MLVAMNTEPLYNRQVHIGRVAMYALGPKGEVAVMDLLYIKAAYWLVHPPFCL